MLTGHFGAELTHGSDFLLAPLKEPTDEQLTLEKAEVFKDLVQPILQSKCVACHNESKVKGELRLDQLTGIQKGGKSGALFVAGNPELSLLIQRIHLPLEDEDHMPPKEKLQLTDEELEILRLWVISGARFDQKVTELPKEEAFFQLVANRFSTEKNYDFPAADPDDGWCADCAKPGGPRQYVPLHGAHAGVDASPAIGQSRGGADGGQWFADGPTRAAGPGRCPRAGG